MSTSACAICHDQIIFGLIENILESEKNFECEIDFFFLHCLYK